MDAAATLVESFLSARDVSFTRAGDQVWSVALAGERKLTIGVALSLGDNGLRIESFFMRAPHENEAEVYRLLLGRNARTRHVWFAVDGLGDVYIAGFVPAGSITEDVLDAMLGELLTVADQMFDAAIQSGFATYLANDLAWRARQSAGDPTR